MTKENVINLIRAANVCIELFERNELTAAAVYDLDMAALVIEQELSDDDGDKKNGKN